MKHEPKAPIARTAYTSPQLVVYGSIAELTKGGHGGGGNPGHGGHPGGHGHPHS